MKYKSTLLLFSIQLLFSIIPFFKIIPPCFFVACQEVCKTKCEHGFVYDKDGCKTCKCKPKGKGIRIKFSSLFCNFYDSLDHLRLLYMYIQCKYIHVYSSWFWGKWTSQKFIFAVQICPPVCAIYCKYGNVLDKHGCKTCKCNPKREFS